MFVEATGTYLKIATWIKQCCGSGSGIRCFFSPRIRDPYPGWFFPDLGSRIPTTSQNSSYINQIYISSKFYLYKWQKRWKINFRVKNYFNYDLFLHEKGKFIFSPIFVGSGIKHCRIWIRDTKKWPEHPGSALGSSPRTFSCLSLGGTI
jgi:hypothetical protein